MKFNCELNCEYMREQTSNKNVNVCRQLVYDLTHQKKEAKIKKANKEEGVAEIEKRK